MNAIRSFIPLAVIVLSLAYSAGSAGQSLPAQLQACFDSGACSRLFELPPSFPGVGFPYDEEIRHWQYFDSNLNEEMFLVQYEIGEPSSVRFESESPFAGTRAINQLFWLTAQQQYVDGRGARLTMYYDDQENSLDPIASETQIFLTSDALLAGTGTDGFDDSYYDPYIIPTPNSMNLDGFYDCLAPGCYFDATFNLIGLDYVRSANGQIDGSVQEFISRPFPGYGSDPELFTLNRGFPGFEPDRAEAFTETFSLVVAPLSVPEPSALLLFGALTLVMAGRRKR